MSFWYDSKHKKYVQEGKESWLYAYAGSLVNKLKKETKEDLNKHVTGTDMRHTGDMVDCSDGKTLQETLNCFSDKIASIDETLTEKSDISSIADNLITDDSSKILSAKQGKVLNDKKVDKVSGKSLSSNDFTNAYKSKLDNLSVNLSAKVDKITGKGLSTYDFDETYKQKLDELNGNLMSKVDKISGKGLSSNDFSNSYKTMLDDLNGNLNLKANKSDVLSKNNSQSFVPTGDYQPATKKYVDDKPYNVAVNMSVADDLATDDSLKALSAKQGKNLSDNIKDILGSVSADSVIQRKGTDGTVYGGFRGGRGSDTLYGCAVGKNAACMGRGAAVGENAATEDGFAGGYNARTRTSEDAAGTEINAVQLGSGLNSNKFTAKIYDYQLLEDDAETKSESDGGKYLKDVGKLSNMITENKSCIVDGINELKEAANRTFNRFIYGAEDVTLTNESFFTVDENGIITALSMKGKEEKNVVIPYKINGIMVKGIGKGVFENSMARSIVLPYGITTIAEQAFESCNSLNKIELPDTITSIGKSAFVNTQIKTIKFPSGLKSIPQYVVSGTYVEHIVIPDGVTTIDKEAFYACRSLKSIEISKTVKSIGDRAFGYSSVKKVVVPSFVETIGENIFTDSPNAKLYCEEGSVADTYATENSVPVMHIATIKSTT